MVIVVIFAFCVALLLLTLSGKLWDAAWLRRSGRELVICWAIGAALVLPITGFTKGLLISLAVALTMGLIVGPCLWLIYRLCRFLFFARHA
jgi:hypothetical protein